MNNNYFEELYRKEREYADNIVRENLTFISGEIPENLLRAMEYSLFSGGKRVRPILVKWSAELGKPAPKMLSRAMAAVEFVHTYSLIHDDLPSMDDDDFRRGKASVHKKFSEAVAILAGDALLTEAFFLLGDSGNSRMVKLLSDNSGARGMVGGQVLDIASHRAASDFAYINELKTARLFKASAAIGAVAGGLDEDGVDKLSCYGINIGKAFQLRDDIMDNEASAEKKALEKALEFIEIAKETVKDFERNRNLIELADFIVKREK